jgi:hypothetical protein
LRLASGTAGTGPSWAHAGKACASARASPISAARLNAAAPMPLLRHERRAGALDVLRTTPWSQARGLA